MSKKNSIFSLNQTAERLAHAMNPKLSAQTKDPELAKDLADIVNRHALGAAAAGIGVAWLPGVGGVAALAAMVGFIWTMYFRVNGRIGLKLSKTLLKSLASAVISNLSQGAISLLGYTLLASLLSLTGAGAVISSALMAAVDYAVVLVGGIIYLKVLTGLFAAGRNPDDMSEKEMHIAMESTLASEDIGELLKSARNHYKDMRKSGEVTGDEHVTVIPD